MCIVPNHRGIIKLKHMTNLYKNNICNLLAEFLEKGSNGLTGATPSERAMRMRRKLLADSPYNGGRWATSQYVEVHLRQQERLTKRR